MVTLTRNQPRMAQRPRQAASNNELYITIGLFVLMACYGPVLRVVGELRYVEIIILGIGIYKIMDCWRTLQRNERILVMLIFLSACAQAISDIYNASLPDASAKRVMTYLILGLLIMALNWITLDKLGRLRAVILGFALSYYLIYLTAGVAGIGGGLADIYETAPWRLGLGYAATLVACLIPTFFQRFRFLAPAMLLILAVVHILQGARTMAGIALITALLAFIALLYGSTRPKKPKATRKIGVALGGVLALTILYQGASFMTANRMMPSDELQKRMEDQLSSEYGLLAAARPDTIAAMYAITKRPIIGYGSSGYDYDVFRFYSFVATSSSFGTSYYDDLLRNQLNKEWTVAMPSHSHLFGIWVDAGIMGIFSWLAVLWLSFSVLVQATYFKSRWTALFIFIAISNLWDVPFSPGPIRMDMAIRIVTLFMALRMMNGIAPITNSQRAPVKMARPIRPKITARPV